METMLVFTGATSFTLFQNKYHLQHEPDLFKGKKKGHKSRLYNLGPLKYVCGGMLFKLHANDKQNLFKKRKDEKHIHSNTLGACVSQTSSATLQGEATVCWPLHFANT